MANWTRGQLSDKIVEQVQSNPKYREELLKNPRALMSKQLGTDIPANVKITVLQETPETYYVVLPYSPQEGQELDDSELEKVAGGMLDKTCTSGPGIALLSTVVNLG
jgi:hypothetical protein